MSYCSDQEHCIGVTVHVTLFQEKSYTKNVQSQVENLNMYKLEFSETHVISASIVELGHSHSVHHISSNQSEYSINSHQLAFFHIIFVTGYAIR